ncbi:Hypp9156 [Branchiostoma lanceolatum]|uniref:Hypp9156 protein n=1 Tax=Branchiostoma lanceolatum TaxID=7740 RepID=A0A8K0EG29_BRALA|nr:Hypp9156 [Branchiostoma lanceolatum]
MHCTTGILTAQPEVRQDLRGAWELVYQYKPEVRQDLRGAWELVQVAQFLRLFRYKFGFADINTQRLEAELRQRESVPIADTLARLLRYLFTRTDIRLGSWEADVKRVLSETGSQWKPFASGAQFADMEPYHRLVFLKGVADHVFEEKVEELSEYLDETYDPEDMRAVPIGQDSLKNTYWYFDDLRLYKESVGRKGEKWEYLRLYKETVGRKGEKWECVCSSLKEWTSFVKKFRKSSHPQEKELYEFLHGQLLPLILGPLQTLEGISQVIPPPAATSDPGAATDPGGDLSGNPPLQLLPLILGPLQNLEGISQVTPPPAANSDPGAATEPGGDLSGNPPLQLLPLILGPLQTLEGISQVTPPPAANSDPGAATDPGGDLSGNPPLQLLPLILGPLQNLEGISQLLPLILGPLQTLEGISQVTPPLTTPSNYPPTHTHTGNPPLQLLPLILGPLQTLEGISQDADRRRFETAEFLRREDEG